MSLAVTATGGALCGCAAGQFATETVQRRAQAGNEEKDANGDANDEWQVFVMNSVCKKRVEVTSGGKPKTEDRSDQAIPLVSKPKAFSS